MVRGVQETVSTETTPQALDVYWRPGCPFCFTLRRALDRRGIPVSLHDIWEDPDAAAVVRAAAGGDETVPTVVLGDRALVNPSAREVEELLAQQAPHLLPPQGERRRRRGRR